MKIICLENKPALETPRRSGRAEFRISRNTSRDSSHVISLLIQQCNSKRLQVMRSLKRERLNHWNGNRMCAVRHPNTEDQIAFTN